MKPDISPIEDIYFLLKKNYNNLLMHEKKGALFCEDCETKSFEIKHSSDC